MDAVLEPTKKQVLETNAMLDEPQITEQGAALSAAAGQAKYNNPKFTLRDLTSLGSQQQLLANFEDYLNGFSPHVQEILENFKFHNQLADTLESGCTGYFDFQVSRPCDRPLARRYRQPCDGQMLFLDYGAVEAPCTMLLITWAPGASMRKAERCMADAKIHRAGQYRAQPTGYRAFLPAPLPPDPPLRLEGELQLCCSRTSLPTV